MPPDRRLLAAIELFNQREFFACHDVLEDLWTDTLGPDRDFYQGLIHVAVCLFHFEGSNLGGARKMYDSARRYLAPYHPAHLTLDVDSLLRDLRHCFRELLVTHSSYPHGIVLNEAEIPVLQQILPDGEPG